PISKDGAQEVGDEGSDFGVIGNEAVRMERKKRREILIAKCRVSYKQNE
ncbi:hypothetical protein MPER_01184, partial [Moniliophthora perniciosa FA553]